MPHTQTTIVTNIHVKQIKRSKPHSQAALHRSSVETWRANLAAIVWKDGRGQTARVNYI